MKLGHNITEPLLLLGLWNYRQLCGKMCPWAARCNQTEVTQLEGEKDISAWSSSLCLPWICCFLLCVPLATSLWARGQGSPRVVRAGLHPRFENGEGGYEGQRENTNTTSHTIKWKLSKLKVNNLWNCAMFKETSMESLLVFLRTETFEWVGIMLLSLTMKYNSERTDSGRFWIKLNCWLTWLLHATKLVSSSISYEYFPARKSENVAIFSSWIPEKYAKVA